MDLIENVLNFILRLSLPEGELSLHGCVPLDFLFLY